MDGSRAGNEAFVKYSCHDHGLVSLIVNSSVRILRVNCSMQIENIVVSFISPRVCREALFQSRAPFSLKSGLVWLFSKWMGGRGDVRTHTN